MSNPAPTPSPATPADEQVSERVSVDRKALQDIETALWVFVATIADSPIRTQVAEIHAKVRAALASPTGDDALLARLEEIEARRKVVERYSGDYQPGDLARLKAALADARDDTPYLIAQLRARLAASPRPAARAAEEK